MPKVVRFVGPSGSGKTALIGALVGALAAEGIRVATYKHAHHELHFDERKDSSRFQAAGSRFVLAVSGTHVVTFRRTEVAPTLDWLVALAPSDVDLVLAEGFHDATGPYFSLMGPGGARDERPIAGDHLGELAFASSNDEDEIIRRVARKIIDLVTSI